MRRSRRRKSGALVAYLYRVDRAKPVRPMTPRKWAALAKAMLARRTCPACRLDAGYVHPDFARHVRALRLPRGTARRVTLHDFAKRGPDACRPKRRPGPFQPRVPGRDVQ